MSQRNTFDFGGVTAAVQTARAERKAAGGKAAAADRKANPPKRRKVHDEEIESESDAGPLSDDEGGAGEDDLSEDEEEAETPAEKRLRIAKAYVSKLRAVEAEVDDDEDDDDQGNINNRDSRVSEHLKQEMREARGYTQRKLAHRVVAPEEHSSVTFCKGHNSAVTAIALSRDGGTAFSSSKDGAIFQWDVETGKKSKFWTGELDSTYKGPAYPGSFTAAGTTSRRTMLAMALSYDGKFLATGGMDRRVHIWDTITGAHLVAFPGHKDIVSGLAFRDGTYQLFSSSYDRTVKHWSLDDLMYMDTLYGHQSEIIGLDCDHRERPITVSRDHTVRLWKVQDETHLVFRGRGSLDCCTVAGQSTWVSGADDGALSLWGTMKKKPLMVSQGAHVATTELGAAAAWVGAVAAVRGSDLVASGAADGAVRLWSVTEDNKLQSLYSVPACGFVNSLAFSRSGQVLVAGMGQEPRLGRWAREKRAKNGLLIHRISYRE